MTNLEIARMFNEENSFKQNVLESLTEREINGGISVGYCIFLEDHEPLTTEQQEIWEEYGDGDELQLWVDIDLNKLLG